MNGKKLIAILVLLLLVPGCGPAMPPDAKPGARRNELRIGTTLPHTQFNAMTEEGAFGKMNYNSFTQAPFVETQDHVQVKPYFAKSWEVSPDNRELLLTFVDNAVWHDGRPVTAEDVKFTFEYFKNLRKSTYLQHLQQVEIVGADKVKLIFSQPLAFSALNKMSTFVFVYPKHIWEKVDNPRAYKGTDTTIGCGPYRFLSYDQASQTSHYQAVDNHFRGKPTIDYISVRSFATHAALVMALKNGEIDAVYDYGNPLEAGVVGVLQGVASVEVGTSGDPGNYQLSFGFKTDPSRDIAFRRAVKYALNYPLMASTIGGYHGAVAGGGIIAPPNRGFRADMPPLRQDKEKAGQLLDGAGYVDRDHDGFRELPNGQPLEVAVTIRFGAAQKPVYLRLFEILQRDLQDIGVRVRLDGSVNNESLWSKRTAVDRDYELYLGFTNAGIASYDSAAYTLVSVAAGGWGTCDLPEYEAAFRQLLASRNYAEYDRQMHVLQQFNDELVPGIALCWNQIFYPYRTDRFNGWIYYLGWGVVNNQTWYQVKPVEQRQ